MGYNFGAKNYKRMRELIKTGVFVTTAIELCVMSNFEIFAPGLIGIFADSDEVICAHDSICGININSQKYI